MSYLMAPLVTSADEEPPRQDYGLEGRGAQVVVPSVVGPIVAAFLVFNRLFWRIHMVHSLAIDDLCIAAALVFLYALAIVNIIGVNAGYAHPATVLNPDDLHLAMQMFYLDQIFYKFSISLTKLSILTLYLRIFTQTWFVRTCWCCFVLVSSYAIASIVTTVFQCTPVDHFWHKDHPTIPADEVGIIYNGENSTARCINLTAFWLSNGVYNIFTDVLILVALLFVIWSLRLARNQKIGLTCVFGLGVFVLVTSVLRLTTLKGGSTAEDPLTGTVVSTMWTMIEASTAVACACLPMCRTPLRRVWPKLVAVVKRCQSGRGW